MNFNPKIKLSLDAKNKHEAIKELSLILKETGKIDNLENFINEINKREEILSTYCGHGVAIPHCESTEVLESGFAFGRSNGLIWDKNDDSVFFIILCFCIVVGPWTNCPETAADEAGKIVFFLRIQTLSTR